MNNRRLLGVTRGIKAADPFEHEEFCRKTFVSFK